MNEKRGVPLSVKMRTYLPHLLIFAIACAAFYIAFGFIAVNAVVACAEVKRINDAPQSEIVFTGERYGEESFYYLKNQHVSGSRQTNVSCDIFMLGSGDEYDDEENDIYFSGSLDKGECAVSANLVAKNGLKTGSTVRVSGTDVTLTVKKIITAQSGIDKEFSREGIMILGFDERLLDKTFVYLAFDTDGDEYRSLISLVYISSWKSANIGLIALYFAIAAALFLIIFIVCERYLFRGRSGDYALLTVLGMKRGRLLATVFFENIIKYILPLIIAEVLSLIPVFVYGAICLLPAAVMLLTGIVFVSVYSIVTVVRLYKCRG